MSELNNKLSKEIKTFIKSQEQPFLLKEEIVKYQELEIFLDEEYAQNCAPTISFNGVVQISIKDATGGILTEHYKFSGTADILDYHVQSVNTIPFFPVKR